MFDIFSRLFDPSGFPPRWRCGAWTAELGWMHILSDLGVWSAYVAIPCVLLYFARKRRDIPFRGTFALFAAFILACGATHLLDAVIFWWPAYRLSAVLKCFTAIISWATVLALISVVPRALTLRSSAELEREIAERKRAEGDLRLFRALIDQTNDAIEVIDPVTARFLDVNEKACQTHGYTREEYLNLCVPDLDPLVRGSSWGERLTGQRVASNTIIESQHKRKDGSTFPVEINVNLIRLDKDYIVAVVRDISERKRTEEQLLLLNRAVQSGTQGIVIVDACKPDLPLVYVSPSFERMTGYTSQEVLNSNCRFMQGPGTDPEALKLIRKAIEDCEPCTVVVLNYRKDGTPFWNELTITPVADDDGKLTHFVGVQTDVTERRRLEEQFRQAQKMEAIGQLAGGVAHDFNNLLMIINGYCEILLESMKPDDPSRAILMEIHRAGVQSAALTNQLLTFSRQQVLAPRLLNLNDIVRETEKLLGRLIGEDIEIAATLDPGLEFVSADPGQIEQVLLNIAVNARDAMPHGGRLTIATANVELDDEYCKTHREVLPGRYVSLTISDTGTGMTEEVRRHIFEPFFTTKGIGKGTGLGLAVVHGIVKQSSGSMEVTSELGVGTSFKIYWPAAQAEETPQSQLLSGPAPHGTGTILLVEDQPAVRDMTVRALRKSGYGVLEATNGEEALLMAMRHGEPIDLLVTDVVMPGMGGRKLAEKLLTLQPCLKVIYISGYTADAVIRNGIQQDQVNFLQKPFSANALSHKVSAVLAQA